MSSTSPITPSERQFTYQLELVEEENGAGSRALSNQDVFPELRGMAINRLLLKPGTLNPPHWHSNSHETVYIISGRALFGIRGLHGEQSIFTAEAGEIVFIERNYLHYFKSIGEGEDEDLEVAVWFTSMSPTTIPLAGALSTPSDSIVAQAFGISESMAGTLKPDDHPLLCGDILEEERNACEHSPFKFKLSGNSQSDLLVFDTPAAGQVRIANPSVFARLKNFVLAEIILKPGALRQIHWHRFPNELNLVISGCGEFGVLTPEGVASCEAVEPDTMMMGVAGSSHYVKNTGEGDLTFLLGFDGDSVSGIDVRDCLQAMPDSIRKQTLGEEADYDQFNTDPMTLIAPPAALGKVAD